MVAHAVEDHLGRHLRAGFHPQGHAVFGIVPHRIVHVFVHSVGHRAEECPHAGLAASQRAEIGRGVGFAETEILVRAVVVTHLAGERHHVGRIEAVLGVVLREGRDTRLVGVRRDIAVGDAAGYPYDALAGVAALAVVLVALADQLHDPRLFGVDDRERLAARGISVGVRQLGDREDRLAGGLGALERDVDQRPVVDQPCRVLQFRAASVGRFADDERMLVHVADGRIGFARLRDVRQVASRVPLVDGQHGPGPEFPAGGVVQGAVERVRIGGIGDHGRAVGRCPFGYDEIGTGCGCAIGEEGCRREAILEFSHRFSGFDPKCTKQILNGKTQRVRYVAFYLDIRALCRIFTTYASALHSGGYPPPVRRYVIVI